MTVKPKHIWKFLFFLWLSIIFPHEAYSFCYAFAPIPYNSLPTTPPTGSTTLTLLDDSYSQIIDIDFTFNFFGVNYNQLLIGSNGLISFDLSQAGTSGFFFDYNGSNSNPNNPTNTIMSPWQNIDPSQGSTVFYYTTGTAPNREFVVVFNQISAFACPNQLETQGMILYETTNEIDIVIGSKTICTTLGGRQVIEGIQNASGTTAYTVPNKNGTLWTTTDNSYRFSPLSAELGSISGPTNPCFASSQNYSIAAVQGATSYTWTVPTGWTITADTGTSITVTVDNMNGNISVTANNACGSSTPQVLAVTVNTIPDQPGPISGSTTPCFESSENYSIAAVPNATSYTWNVPADWTITANAGTSITVIIGNMSGNISVTANNACGSSNPQVLAVTVSMIPNQPGPIFGFTNPCFESSQNYSIAAVPGATSYTWNVPIGWTITADTGTSITVTVGNTSGNINVTANNACGSSNPQVLAVTVDLIPTLGAIIGPNTVTLGQIATYSIPFVNGFTYAWSYSGSGVQITSFDNQVVINFSPQATQGTLAVSVTNHCGTSSPSILPISIEILPPSQINGRKIANQFATQTEYVNVIRWSASPSPGVKSYHIYRNDVLIEEVQVPHKKFKDYNRSINQSDFYAIRSVGTNDQESEPITISIR